MLDLKDYYRSLINTFGHIPQRTCPKCREDMEYRNHTEYLVEFLCRKCGRYTISREDRYDQ